MHHPHLDEGPGTTPVPRRAPHSPFAAAGAARRATGAACPGGAPHASPRETA
ncbi:hypothetical protein ABR738_33430 [Streptomyces sp. Edi4]|uniref:hypothetical protein n=1 Tax=Streptomyces sp. Edi4 TaxID=3162527 RepID=UPI003305736D